MTGGARPAVDAALFDLGKVLLDWDPRYYYRRFFDDADALERFVAEAIAPDWILEMDAGKPAREAIAERQARLPEHAALIARWSEGWPLMLKGEIAGTARVVDGEHGFVSLHRFELARRAAEGRGGGARVLSRMRRGSTTAVPDPAGASVSVIENGAIRDWVPFTRFVLNQDTGGAIKGPGRVDLFWGQGNEAELAAGYMQQEGKLYFLIRKK